MVSKDFKYKLVHCGICKIPGSDIRYNNTKFYVYDKFWIDYITNNSIYLIEDVYYWNKYWYIKEYK